MRRIVCSALLVAACQREVPPEGQLVIAVTTDAPIGPGPSAPLFDRLRIEIVPPGEGAPCAGCAREFALDDDTMARGRASMGFFPRVDTPGYRARVRLYRSGTASGEPRRASTLERVVALPPVGGEGVTEVTAVLRLETLGRPQGTLDAPVEITPGPPPPDLVGSFPGVAPTPCVGAPRDDEACVPGGAAWMGSPRLDVLDAREADGTAERVVVIAPFFVDRTEVTVAAMRAARVARVVDDPVEAGTLIPGCLYTPNVGPNDDLPVNCLSWQRARAYCAKVGKRMLTEAEYEYVAGARASRSFPWGSKLPGCPDAVHGAGTRCPDVRGPRPPGSAALDRVDLGGGAVVDLAGNLRELVADRYRRGDETPCWGVGVFRDPVCEPDPPEPNVPRSLRGGSYDDEPTLLRAALRAKIEDERFAVSPIVGFRCARDAR